jgi:type I restriction enzyme M protein
MNYVKNFVSCYTPQNRHKRTETWSEDNPDGRWHKFTYDEIKARDKTSLDIFWIRDENLADLDNLPDPDVLAEEIIENLEAGVESFKQVMQSLNGR